MKDIKAAWTKKKRADDIFGVFHWTLSLKQLTHKLLSCPTAPPPHFKQTQKQVLQRSEPGIRMNPYVLKFFPQSCDQKNGLFSSLFQCSARGGRDDQRPKGAPQEVEGREAVDRTEGLILSGEGESKLSSKSNPNTGFAPLCSSKALP